MRLRNNPTAQNRLLMPLLTGIAVALIWISHRHHQSLDLSANARHTLTPVSQDIAQSITGPLTVLAVVGPNMEQRAAITLLIDRYREYKSNISLEFINPEINPARARELGVSSGSELILQLDERETRLQSVSERTLTQALHKLSRASERTVAFVSGHGERDVERQTNADYAFVAASLRRIGLNLQPLSLVSVPRVPDNIDALVIAAPTQKFFPGEVASVLDYVTRGGNLLWLIEGGELAGLKAVALELGIEMFEGVVIDASSQAWGAESPTFAVIDTYPQHPVNIGLASPVLLPESRALNLTPLAGQIVTPLLQTGTDSWTETGQIEGAVQFDAGTTEQQGPLVLAATIERPLTASNTTGETQRIAVFADADLFASTWIGNGANREYAERVFNWMVGEDASIEFTTAPPRDRLERLTQQQTLIIGAGFLLVLPSLFLLIALWLWHRHKHS
ncbi:MAG: GldG family protein [Gammaproteobacteria bacterium]|nr:GldG family protein [Gammaproteobacteria bacterium]